VVRELVRFDTPPAPAARPLAVPMRTLPEAFAAAVAPVARPDGSRSAPPETLGYLLVLTALVFVLGVECGVFWCSASRVRESQAKDDEG
jgi:hypothetical protein